MPIHRDRGRAIAVLENSCHVKLALNVVRLARFRYQLYARAVTRAALVENGDFYLALVLAKVVAVNDHGAALDRGGSNVRNGGGSVRKMGIVGLALCGAVCNNPVDGDRDGKVFPRRRTGRCFNLVRSGN